MTRLAISFHTASRGTPLKLEGGSIHCRDELSNSRYSAVLFSLRPTRSRHWKESICFNMGSHHDGCCGTSIENPRSRMELASYQSVGFSKSKPPLGRSIQEFYPRHLTTAFTKSDLQHLLKEERGVHRSVSQSSALDEKSSQHLPVKLGDLTDEPSVAFQDLHQQIPSAHSVPSSQ